MNFKTSGILFTLALTLSGCVADENPFASGYGKIKASFSANYNVNSSTSVDRSGDISVITPDVKDFSVHLVKEDGSYDKTWSSVAEFPTEDQFTTGAYTMTASYGALDVEGFDKPYFAGAKEVKVFDAEVADATITCELANTMISVKYTDAFKNYFTDYTTKIHSSGGAYVEFVKGEARAAYVKPGAVTMLMSLTKTDGKTTTFEPAQIANALAKTHYRITFDVNGGNVGDAQLTISFDDATTVEPITINLTDELMNAPLPIIATTGYDSATPINILAGDEAPTQLKSQITARSGISSVTLTTNSEFLKSKGWPAEINLVAATEAERTLLKSLGLNVTGLWGNVDKMAIVDFTNIIKNLRVVNNSTSHTFSLQVKDKFTKVCENPAVLTINAPSAELAIATPEEVLIGEAKLTANVSYNGTNLKDNVKMLSIDSYGVWQDSPITNVTELSAGLYEVEFTVTNTTSATNVKAVNKTGLGESNVVTYSRINPKFSVSGDDDTAFAKNVVLTIAPEDPEQLDLIMEYITINHKSATGAWTKSNISKNITAGTVKVSGLNANAAYSFRGTITPGENYSNEVAMTTEEVSTLPNGDFETIASTIDIGSINQGGKWSNLTNWGAKYNTTSIKVSEPTGWASVNAKTCSTSASTKNTWFMVPSTYMTAAAQSGTNAVEIRNVAWDLSGSEPGRDTRGDTQNWSSKTPGSFANKSAGKLFLGAYSFIASTGEETYTEGYAITTRPSSVKGYYKYANDGNDGSETGSVLVQVLSGTDVIGSGSLNFAAVGDYTTFTAPITYTVFNKKATQIKVMFTSSNHASYTQATESASVKTTNYAQPAISTGAVLNIDNITLSYE